LRRPNIQQIFLLRSQINHLIRNYFVDQNFVEVETPFFGKSTPEGARDFLVPSRLNKNKFYALPQSPQLFKQLLMVAGFDRYFQIVRCFRDEDLRVDRELEFTQLDMEMSFAKPDDVMKMMEELLKLILKKGAHEEISQAFQRITYREAIEKYGSDKPDLRFELPIQTLTKILANSSNKLIQTFLTKQEEIRGLGINKLLNKAQLEAVNQIAQQFNLFGITYVKLNDNI
jgi:aspartyl-tRNA synthetase